VPAIEGHEPRNHWKGKTHELGHHQRQLEAGQGQGQEQWGKLTDDDFDMIDGRREQLAGRIQERYGVTRDEAEKQIKDWEDRAS
jgi:Uncharacterized protein conserved in bacteria